MWHSPNFYRLTRIRRHDFSEWLKSKGRIVGLDKLGNEVEHSFTDPEVHFTPWTRYDTPLEQK